VLLYNCTTYSSYSPNCLGPPAPCSHTASSGDRGGVSIIAVSLVVLSGAEANSSAVPLQSLKWSDDVQGCRPSSAVDRRGGGAKLSGIMYSLAADLSLSFIAMFALTSAGIPFSRYTTPRWVRSMAVSNLARVCSVLCELSGSPNSVGVLSRVTHSAREPRSIGTSIGFRVTGARSVELVYAV